MEAQHEVAEGHAHPSPAEYVKIAIILAIATALEVALYYLEFLPEGLIVGLLMFFMVVKFALVVLWFMHLRFDSVLFRRLFVVGIVLAIGVYTVVLLTFGVLIGT